MTNINWNLEDFKVLDKELEKAINGKDDTEKTQDVLTEQETPINTENEEGKFWEKAASIKKTWNILSAFFRNFLLYLKCKDKTKEAARAARQ